MSDDAPRPSHVNENAPPGWLQNDLTSMMEVAHENRWATFHNMRAECNKLTAIYKLFGDVSREWINPKQNLIACNLFLRAHSTFFASCNLAFGGQVAETYPLTRLTLEYSASALRIHRDDELAVVFLNRHEDDASYRASKKAFGTADLKACVRAEDTKLADTFDALYQASIDRGGHPNERVFLPAAACWTVTTVESSSCSFCCIRTRDG